ncbi:hypothetical protein KIPB_012813 [Kipferlia bialata]|uniref:Uncharacterized protein n=1 Tax=Kipferlia bialata TaxID=797122 RepID=A0A391NRR3_9EUKA|nr:hypothetical protein KIPB_012813 [Kipferlia bialata]|eukprot:g12813.t1
MEASVALCQEHLAALYEYDVTATLSAQVTQNTRQRHRNVIKAPAAAASDLQSALCTASGSVLQLLYQQRQALLDARERVARVAALKEQAKR